MNNPFDYTPDVECEEAFRNLLVKIETLKHSDLTSDMAFIRELEAGKMLGVLIAEDRGGTRHTLYAFSGQLGEGGFYRDGFVGPVFDYLQPNGNFKTKEADISHQNAVICLFEATTLHEIRSMCEEAQKKMDAEISAYKDKCHVSKQQRDARRMSGALSEADRVAMMRQSQFEKAELHRLKSRLSVAFKPLKAVLDDALGCLEVMKEKRRADSESLQRWLFDHFVIRNARGESRSLSEIFRETPMLVPPSGSGECCAPKLIQEAYLRHWLPISMAEYWYGAPKDGEVRIHGRHYPACRGKCLPVLNWMLQGLDINPPLESDIATCTHHNPKIIFENEWFCVVDKPSGMLSVPGKGVAVSVETWLREKFGRERFVKMAHRLDQDTSGLIVAALTPESYKAMQALFATRMVAKTYMAELEGDYRSQGRQQSGRIDLPLSPDWLDRPRQRVDLESGKPASTEYAFTGVSGGRSRVEFHPLTGRTHQLRVHAASLSGLGMPIVGDRLYGSNAAHSAGRLLLHSYKLRFTFPIDGCLYSFESPLPF